MSEEIQETPSGPRCSKVDRNIHWINYCAVDKFWKNQSRYPVRELDHEYQIE